MDAVSAATWLRRNALALSAVAVLLPVTAAVVVGNEWWSANSGRDVFPVTVAEGESARFGGISWGPARASDAEPGENAELPPRTKVIAVDIPVDRHGKATTCTVTGLRETSGAQREWQVDTKTTDWNYRLQTFCKSESTVESGQSGPFTLSLPFVVPDDIDGPLAVDLVVIDELPRFLRVEVTP